MSALTNLYENAILDGILATASFTAPTSVSVALFTSPVSVEATSALLEAGDFTNEVDAGGYARVSATFADAANGSASTNANITWNTASGDWGTVTHVGIVDNEGQISVHGVLDVAKEILTGDTFEITSGNLTVTLA